jgi:hypothetical protein
MPDELQPWDQQPGEPSRWYGVFFAFCTAGSSRSLLGVYNQHRQAKGKQGTARRVPGAWDRACRKWNWRARAAAWDWEQRRLRALKLQERRDQMTDNQATLGAALWSVGSQDLDKVKPEELSVQDRLRLIEAGVRIERLALGEPDSIQQRNGEQSPSASVNVGICISDILAKIREAERLAKQQAQLEHQADGPARIAYQPSANGYPGNGRGG